MPHLLILRGAMGAGKTSVANELSAIVPGIELIEIDEIKMRKYGTSKRCRPNVDFPEAGRIAQEALDQGRHAIVIEPLCKKRHLADVLQTAGRSEQSDDVSIVWLGCSVETALNRKRDSYKESVIRSQHERYESRYCSQDEEVISTDDTTVLQVAAQLAARFR